MGGEVTGGATVEGNSWRPLSERGCHRYSVISQVLARMLRGEERAEAVKRVAAQAHARPDGRLVRLSERTIYRWLAAYEESGSEGLENRPRTAVGSRALPGKLLAFMAAQLADDPEGSIPEIILRARGTGVVKPEAPICRQTVYRALLRLGIQVCRRKKIRCRDTRRFAYEQRMQMVLCDGKHFRAGATRQRRVAFTFLDDATRFGLNLVVGPSESAALFLRGLYETVRCHGRMLALYLDRGPGFIALDVADVCRRLEIRLVLGEAAYPEGHGKIERLNQTLKRSVLRNLDRRPDVDPACGALELRLRHWLREVYNHTPHESLVREQEE